MQEQEQLDIFKHWLEAHKGLLFKIIRSYARSVLDQDDLFQEISIQLWRSIPSFRQQSAATTWIYRVALNTAMKWSRKSRRHVEGRQEIEPILQLLEDKKTETDPRIDWLYEAIGSLDEIDRSLCLLFLDGFSYKEMAKMMGIKENHIGVKIHRIKKKLLVAAQKYEHHGF